MHWTPQQLADDCEGDLLVAGPRSIDGAFIDSRAPRPGGLFVPIVAARDGHDFIDAAISAGAAGVLVGEGRPIPRGEISIVRVRDTLEALTRLARRARDRVKGPVVSVSGSNGKTTTRAMIAAVLETGPRPVLATRGNLNNHLGVPLTLLGEPHEPGSMVLEFGMNAPGENDHLASIVRADIHVITSVALEHLEFMKTIEAIAAAEAEPLAHLAHGGLVVVPRDEPRLVPHLGLAVGATVRTFGFAPGADLQILGVRQTDRTEVDFTWGKTAHGTIRLRSFGAHNALNAAAALLVGRSLDLDLRHMIEALEAVAPVGDRGRAIAWGRHLIVADCYNANPGSVEAALRSFAALRGERSGPLVAVLGDMLELGPTAGSLHADVGRLAAAVGLNALIGLGPHMREAVAAAREVGLDAEHCGHDVEAAVHAVVRRTMSTGSPTTSVRGAVLVKGSRGMRLERVVDGLLAVEQPDSSV